MARGECERPTHEVLDFGHARGMRSLLPLLLIGCATSSPGSAASSATAGDEGVSRAAAEASRAAEAARVLVAALDAPNEPAALADAVESLRRALARGDEPWNRRLLGVVDGFRRPDLSERDRGELVEIAIATSWELSHERAAGRAADPETCAVVRVLALRGLSVWRAELAARLEREGQRVTAADHGDYTSQEFYVRDGCEHLDEASSKSEACTYRNRLVHAHWVAFGDDGPLAAIETGLRAGPREAARAVAENIEATRPLFDLLTSPRPQRGQVAELAILCGG